MKAKDRFIAVFAGDSCITRRISGRGHPFVGLRKIVKSADVAFTNLETLFHSYEGWAMHESHGAFMRSDPALARELSRFGFNMLSLANNHAGDYGVDGLQRTMRHVRAAGLAFAGAGRDLDQARRATFVTTPVGIVGLVCFSCTFPPHARAGRGRGTIPGRPGINGLRHSTRLIVTREWLDRFEDLLLEVVSLQRRRAPELWVPPGAVFAVGSTPGLCTEMNPLDLKETASIVEKTAQASDYTFVSMHAHESGQTREQPSPLVRSLAREMIDAGADCVAGHGPHVLRGIEIYKNRPIFYSLGNFVNQLNMVEQFPAEMYEQFGLNEDADAADLHEIRAAVSDFAHSPACRESILAELRWSDGKKPEIRLHPVVLHSASDSKVDGCPRLAPPQARQRILARLSNLSRQFSTRIETRNGVGYINF